MKLGFLSWIPPRNQNTTVSFHKRALTKDTHKYHHKESHTNLFTYIPSSHAIIMGFFSAFLLIVITIIVSNPSFISSPLPQPPRSQFVWRGPTEMSSELTSKQFPPLGVFAVAGCGADLLINILLTILGYLPGHLHAFYLEWVYYERKEQTAAGRLMERPAPGIFSERVQGTSYGTIPERV